MEDPESHRCDVEWEEHISFVARNAIPKAVTLSEIESVAAKDSMLQAVKEQLTCTDTVLSKSDRLVIPATLQEGIVDIAHEGHLGIVKTKTLLR